MKEIEIYPEYYEQNEPGIYQDYIDYNLTTDLKPVAMINEDVIDELICNSVMENNEQAIFDILEGIKKLFKFKYKEKLDLVLWSCSHFNMYDLKNKVLEWKEL